MESLCNMDQIWESALLAISAKLLSFLPMFALPVPGAAQFVGPNSKATARFSAIKPPHLPLDDFVIGEVS